MSLEIPELTWIVRPGAMTFKSFCSACFRFSSIWSVFSSQEQQISWYSVIFNQHQNRFQSCSLTELKQLTNKIYTKSKWDEYKAFFFLRNYLLRTMIDSHSKFTPRCLFSKFNLTLDQCIYWITYIFTELIIIG